MIVTVDGGVKSWPLRGAFGSGPLELPRPRSMILLGDRRTTYAAMFKEQPWVHTVVTKLARGVARLPLCTYELDDDTGARKRLRDHPLGNALAHPYEHGSAFSLKEHWVGSLALYGHSVSVMDRPGPGQPPTEFWPLNMQEVAIVGDKNHPIAYYEWRGGIYSETSPKRFLPQDVLHLMWWGPEGMGVSPLEPLRRALVMEDAAQRSAISSFSNGMRPSGAIRTDQKIPSPERKELKAEIDAIHGGPDRAFKVALLTHGLDWTPFSHSAQEAEVIAHRKLNRDEVCSVYDIPPPMVHILDRATFSNIDEQHRMWYQDSLAPWLTMISEGIGIQVIEPNPSFGNVLVEFDLDEVLKGDADKRSRAAQRWFQTATRTPNEQRRDEGLDPIGDPADPNNEMNWVYVPQNMKGIRHPEATVEEPEPEQPPEVAPTNGGPVPPERVPAPAV